MLIHGKRGTRKAWDRHLTLDTVGEEAPHKIMRGATAAETTATPPGRAQQVELVADAMEAEGSGIARLLESLPEEASDGAPPVPLSSVTLSMPRQLLSWLLAGRTLGLREETSAPSSRRF